MIDPKGLASGCFGPYQGEMATVNRKTGVSSRTPNVVYYRVKYTTGYRESQRKLLGIIGDRSSEAGRY
jgi:hypothetical protein